MHGSDLSREQKKIGRGIGNSFLLCASKLLLVEKPVRESGCGSVKGIRGIGPSFLAHP